MKCANDFLIMNVGMKTLRYTGGTGVIVLYSILQMKQQNSYTFPGDRLADEMRKEKDPIKVHKTIFRYY